MSSQDQWPPAGQQPQYPRQPPTQQWPAHPQQPGQQWAGPTQTAPVKQVKRWPAATGAGVVSLLLGIGIGASGSGGTSNAISSPAATVTVTVIRKSQPVAAPSTIQAQSTGALKAPAGVSVSGEKAKVLQIVSFKARRDALGGFAPVLRIKNVTGDDLSFVSVKVTALKGQDVKATADGIIESISAGQTVTFEPLSTDDFGSGAGLSYDVEIGG